MNRNLKEQAGFTSGFKDKKEPEDIAEKIKQSLKLLTPHVDSSEVLVNITRESFVLGVVPRLSPFDLECLPPNLKLIEVPHELQERQRQTRSFDLLSWNNPEAFLQRLRIKDKPFVAPGLGNSQTMNRFIDEQKVISFENLRIETPSPTSTRNSRTINYQTLEHKIMGRARIPLAFGSVPDVGSALAYITMAQANGLVFVSRDKILSDVENQTYLVKTVIDRLKETPLPKELLPNENQLIDFWEIMQKPAYDFDVLSATKLYEEELRLSWISNVGAAIEASPRGVERAKSLYGVGCKTFRIYSPEGGLEIPKTVAALHELRKLKNDPSLKIVAGQIMDIDTALKAEREGCDALIIGVAGGSQCTTSVNADIPVNAPNLLYKLRGRVNVPIGIEGGGVGTHMMTAFALGASFLCKPGEIGLSLEGAGGTFIFQDHNKGFWMLYGGEASDSAKWWRDSIDTLGRPLFVEGEIGVRQLSQDQLFMTNNIRRLLERIAIGLVFQRTNTIAELHTRDCSNIVEVSQNAAQLNKTYLDPKIIS